MKARTLTRWAGVCAPRGPHGSPLRESSRVMLTLGLGALLMMCGFAGTADGQTLQSPEDLQASRSSLRIQSRMDGGRWSKASAVSALASSTIELRIKPPQNGSKVRWYLVFPDITEPYNNANPPGTPGAYKWKGFDTIRYYRMELEEHRDKTTINPMARGFWARVKQGFEAKGLPFRERFYKDGVGTFRFQAVVEHDGKSWRTPGLEDVDGKGISTSVFRLSVRDSDTYVGYVRSYFNVPGIFGSVLHQSNHYIGVDCADLLIGARGHYTKRKATKNFNVAMLVQKMPHVAEFELEGGTPSKKISWSLVQPGDFIAVRYEGATRYQHIGALYQDHDQDGVLSPADLVLHAGPYPPAESRLEWGAFDGHVVILRPR